MFRKMLIPAVIVSPCGISMAQASAPAHGLPLATNDNFRHFGKGQTEAAIERKPGKHTQLALGEHLHIPFNPVVASQKITSTVN